MNMQTLNVSRDQDTAIDGLSTVNFELYSIDTQRLDQDLIQEST